jgi:Secretion system C-terminal sorting domain
MRKMYLPTLAVFFTMALILQGCSNAGRQEGPAEEGEGKPIVLESFEQWTSMRSYPFEEIRAQGFARSHGNLRREMQMQALQPDQVTTAPWQALAPMNFAGRILCMAVNPTNANTIFVGSASGGLWKTTTGGTGGPGGISWTYVPTGFPVLGVGAIAINPQNGNEIYVGTGEIYNKNEKGVTPGGHIRTYRGFYGIGILKSTDGGATWTQSLSFTASNLEGVNDFVVNPQKPSTVYAATSDGLYRTFNSGANWTKIHAVVMAMDLAMKPGDTNTLFVGSGNFGSIGNGIYRSTNAGAATPTFTRLTSGLPTSYTGMARIAIAPTNTTKMYASIGHDPGTTTKYGLYVSTNGGTSWTKASTTNIINGQGWYAHDVVVDPANANTVYWSEIDIYRSTNSGSTLSKRSSWSGWNLSNTTIGTTREGTSNYTHADNHRLFFANGRLYTCTDGGLFSSTDAGTTWNSLNGGLQTAQIYPNISAGRTDPNYMLLGLQDNGTFVYRGVPGSARVIGADGFCTAIDPANDNIGFAQFYFFNVKKSTDKGATFPTTSYTNNYNAQTIPNEMACFNAPIIFANNNTNIMYGGTIYLKKSTNKGSTWTNGNSGAVISGSNCPIINLAAAPTDDNVVYISTAPGSGIRSRMFVSTNGGTSVTNITGALPDRYYSKIAVDPYDKNRAVITLSGFGTSHVFLTYNAGASWTDIGAGLPDVPHNTVTFDPNNTSIIYVGNDIGVYFATDVPVSDPGAAATLNWTPYNEGFTDATLVSDLLVTSNNKLRLATHGRGLWERDLAVSPSLGLQISELTAESGISSTMVSWKARHETLVSHYELEYSEDGTRFTFAVKTTPQTRSAGTPNVYQLAHQDGQASAGYYRVKIVLQNGQSYYSGILQVARGNAAKMKIYPNPVRESLQFSLLSQDGGKVELMVIDMNGRLLLTKTVNLVRGQNQVNIPVMNLAPGNYRLVTSGAVNSNNPFIHVR